jgi:hypothetical protein
MSNLNKSKTKKAFERIHLGKNGTVRIGDVIGFFDLDGSTESETTKDFLKRIEKEYKMVNLLYDLPKSFVVTTESENESVYMLSNSVETEIKRMGENK